MLPSGIRLSVRGITSSKGYPGGEISDEAYEAMRSRYQRMHENLTALQGHGLLPKIEPFKRCSDTSKQMI